MFSFQNKWKRTERSKRSVKPSLKHRFAFCLKNKTGGEVWFWRTLVSSGHDSKKWCCWEAAFLGSSLCPLLSSIQSKLLWHTNPPPNQTPNNKTHKQTNTPKPKPRNSRNSQTHSAIRLIHLQASELSQIPLYSHKLSEWSHLFPFWGKG